MALKISETPILTNEDAEKFENEIKNVKPLSRDKMKKIKTSYELLKNCSRED